MTERPEPKSRHRRLPRWAYWLTGATVACSGALAANHLSADLPVGDRPPYWLAGSASIFLGLWILSLGTRARIGGWRDDPDG